MVFSVGGGNKEKNINTNLLHTLVYAKQKLANFIGLVGRDGDYTEKIADACCLITVVNLVNTTLHTQFFQTFVWSASVSHPKIKISDTKW